MNKIYLILLAAFVSLNSFGGDCTVLSGTYTIGKNEGNDFPTVTDAVNALQCGGVSGPVKFLLESGEYEERVALSAIPGSSAFNTVTFESKSGINTDVVISYVSTDATFIINGANYLTLENISINHRDAPYGNVMRINGKASNLNFKGVAFDGVEAARIGSNNAVIYFSSTAPKTDIVFDNCEIDNGSIGIAKGGISSDIADTRTTITGTLFFNQFETGLYLFNEDAPVISNNVFSSRSNFSNYKGISFDNVANHITLSNNIITMATGSTGIELHNCMAEPSRLGQLTGNSIAVGGKDEASGIAITGSTDNQVLNFNRVKLNYGDETTRQAYYRNSGSGRNINMLNNIFFDFSTGGYTIVGNTFKDFFNQLPAQSNPSLRVSANGLMIEKATPVTSN